MLITANKDEDVGFLKKNLNVSYQTINRAKLLYLVGYNWKKDHESWPGLLTVKLLHTQIVFWGTSRSYNSSIQKHFLHFQNDWKNSCRLFFTSVHPENQSWTCAKTFIHVESNSSLFAVNSFTDVGLTRHFNY